MGHDASTIGHYAITREIGRGGMGVVHLARDTRLDRDVAIKALPSHFADDAHRLTRFQHEAKTLAQLQHPNIAAIYGVEEHDGRQHLVLEYVEGETLEACLSRGALPVDDAIDICAKIAAGIEAAHEAGVIHRDLKPGNVIINDSGVVKVLDFGLAMSSGMHTDAADDPAVVSTRTHLSGHPATAPGTVLGTAPYMSPEQVRGKPLDRRTDIWSFGVMLFECLTGRNPFHRGTGSDVIAAILHDRPDFDQLPADTPPQVRHVLLLCLERDRNRRLRDIGDARLELERAYEDDGRRPTAAPARSRARLWMTAAALMMIAGAVVAGYNFGLSSGGGPSVAAETIYLSVPAPILDVGPFYHPTGLFDLSPDGKWLAYIGKELGVDDESSPRAVYLRRLNGFTAVRVEDTDNASNVRFSPDGSTISFVCTDPRTNIEQLRRKSVSGGPPLTILEDATIHEYQFGFAPRWLTDDELLFMSQDCTTLYRIDADGGSPQVVSTDMLGGARQALQPVPVPGRRAALFTRYSVGRGGLVPFIHSIDVETGEIALVAEDAGHPRVTSTGHILFTRGSTLCAAPFDTSTLQIEGAVTPMLDDLFVFDNRLSDWYEISDAGHLVYWPQVEDPTTRRLVSIDRSGAIEKLDLALRAYTGHVALSPDGQSLACMAMTPSRTFEVTVIDIISGNIHKTPDDIVAVGPFWLVHDRLSFSTIHRAWHTELMIAAPTQLHAAQPLLPEPDQRGIQQSASLTPDGRHLVFLYHGLDPGAEPPGIYMLAMDDVPDATPQPIVTPIPGGSTPALSPEGNWLAYDTDVTGRKQILLRRLDLDAPQSQRDHAVSRDGGNLAFWSADGSELFYWSVGEDNELRDLLSVHVETEPELRLSQPTRVLSQQQMQRIVLGSRPITVTPDGERFIYVQRASVHTVPQHFNIVMNWLGELESRVPARH